MIKIDMWHGDKVSIADKISILFNDLDAMYYGNIYHAGECVGDYIASDAEEVEKTFPQLTFIWDQEGGDISRGLIPRVAFPLQVK